MSYPDIETYEKLYKRFLDGDRTEQMLEMAGDISGKVFLDICCGGGRLTKEALHRGTKKNIMIDAEAKMISGGFRESGFAQVLIMSVQDALQELINTKKKEIEIAICQQGINYWLTEAKAWRLSLTMSKKGLFIFNTFNQKPSEIPKIKEYVLPAKLPYAETHYTEITWMVKNKEFDIYHIQICQGEAPHFTQFKWMDDKYIQDSLKKFFHVELIKDGRTSIYRCVKI